MMILYKNTFKDVSLKEVKGFPREDWYWAEDNVAVVADGITRDPIGVFDFSEYSFLELLERYPNPSGGELAAKEIITTFKKSNFSLKERLIECNEAVKKLNQKYIKECDYLQHDYYGAVASCCKLEKNFLEYAYICDCGVIVYDSEGKIKFQTEDDKELYSDPYINEIGIPWEKSEARVIVRRDFRNNPSNIQDGKCVSYGAITGEEEMVEFLRYGKVNLEKEDIILIYSDGFVNFLHEEEFIDRVIHFEKKKFESFIEELSKKDSKRYGHEKTLVMMKNKF